MDTVRARSQRLSREETLAMCRGTVLVGEGLAVPAGSHHQILTTELWRELYAPNKGVTR